MRNSTQESRANEARTYLNAIVYELYARAQGVLPDRLREAVVVDSPSDFAQVTSAPDVFVKDFGLLTRFGRSRFDTNGEDWKRRRDLSQPAYLAAARPVQLPAIEAAFQNAFARFDPATPATLPDRLFAASLTIFFAAFGTAADPAPFLPVMADIREAFRPLQYLTWNGGAQEDLRDAEAFALGTLGRFAARCAAEPALAAFVEALRVQGDSIPGFDPVSEFAINAFAGIETTTAALSWMIDRLGSSPAVQSRLRNELAQGGETPLLDVFIDETLRYFPPIPFVTRKLAAPATLGARDLAEGDTIIVSVIGLHHDRTAWESPGVFDARRREFLDNSYDRRAFAPFLLGPRSCGGMRLAKLEMRAALANFIPRFEVSLRGERITLDYSLAMRPTSWRNLDIVRLPI